MVSSRLRFVRLAQGRTELPLDPQLGRQHRIALRAECECEGAFVWRLRGGRRRCRERVLRWLVRDVGEHVCGLCELVQGLASRRKTSEKPQGELVVLFGCGDFVASRPAKDRENRERETASIARVCRVGEQSEYTRATRGRAAKPGPVESSPRLGRRARTNHQENREEREEGMGKTQVLLLCSFCRRRERGKRRERPGGREEGKAREVGVAFSPGRSRRTAPAHQASSPERQRACRTAH